MVPSLDLQLQASIKALTDAIRPAVDPADKVASEQIHLVLATLTMVRERLPVQRRFIRRLLEDAAELGEAVNASERHQGLTEAISTARLALRDPELEADELEAVRSTLTNISAEVVAGAGAGGLIRFGSKIARHSKTPLDRLRAWSISSGFEPDASAVNPLNELI